MNLLKEWWARGLRRARDEYEDTQSDLVRAPPFYRWLFYGVAFYVVGAICLGIYWSSTPAAIDVRAAIQEQMPSGTATPDRLPAGVATTSTLIVVSQRLLDKTGGYIANDVFPPGIWLDNMPHWEMGVLLQVRDTANAIQMSLSQSHLNHQLDADLQKANARFNFSHTSWSFPASESQYRSGIEHLQQYNRRLLQTSTDSTGFYADAQHLNDYLAGVEQRLKNLSQRLTASVGPTVNTDAAAIPVKQPASPKIVSALYTKTPRLQVDDIFYEARGSSWALIALLQAIEIDFADVLQTKNAKASYDQIIRELKPTQEAVFSPIILNGESFGFAANHSLTMASYLARAQAAISDCRRQLLVSAP